MQINSLLLLLLPVTMGIMIGLALRAGRVHRNSAKGLERLDFVVIHICLPMHVALTYQIIGPEIWNLKWDAAFGLALPICTWVLATLFGAGTRTVFAPLAAASFGGGNRGVFLLSLLGAVALSSQISWLNSAFSNDGKNPILLDHFAIMDFFYFAFFSIAAPEFARRLSPRYAENPGIVGLTGLQQLKVLRGPLTTALLLFASFVLVEFGLIEAVVDPADARFSLSLFISTAATMLVVTRFKLMMSIDVIGIAGKMFAARAVALGFFCATAFGVSQLGYLAPADLTKMLIIFGVFLAVPPSSYVTSFIASHADQADIETINSISGTWNVLFYVVAIGFCLAVYLLGVG